ncbi:BMC domain-containing protein [Anaerobacillus alkaliphilus]|uniref:BMC domain-containing protein n=1 Tax=Anaerobacillus alkaliphilus TaxID=1548597 RepID=A0A4Q0VXP4_9BACI|nr:BMC domain-containing protein [Anaerobacillus alkaliphilus]RXJ04172.1 BMC domain-containing protein [Anaerobacillus alkaliphilus]
MGLSLGMLEVRGMGTTFVCIDKMVKSAFVEVTRVEQIGSGVITIFIQGELASVQYAIAVGEEVVQSYGQFIASRVIARPYNGLEKLTAQEEKVVKHGEN